MTEYWIIGGEYKNTEFDQVADGQKIEEIGPFKSYDEAKKAWSSKAWDSVDDCNARYEIVER